MRSVVGGALLGVCILLVFLVPLAVLLYIAELVAGAPNDSLFNLVILFYVVAWAGAIFLG